jgi:hypothetical protein
MIGTRPRARSAIAPSPVDSAVAVVDGALRSVGSRDAMSRAETIELLGAVRASAADLGAADGVAAILDELVMACEDAPTVGAPRVADALLDVRLALAGSA